MFSVQKSAKYSSLYCQQWLCECIQGSFAPCKTEKVMENQNFKIQARKTWKISVGHGKSWKIRFLLDKWIILSQFSSLTFSSFLGSPMDVKNIAKIVSTILVILIYHSLAMHFNSETGVPAAPVVRGSPCSACLVVSIFSWSWILVNTVTESHEKVMEFWWASSVRTLCICLSKIFRRYRTNDGVMNEEGITSVSNRPVRSRGRMTLFVKLSLWKGSPH